MECHVTDKSLDIIDIALLQIDRDYL